MLAPSRIPTHGGERTYLGNIGVRGQERVGIRQEALRRRAGYGTQRSPERTAYVAVELVCSGLGGLAQEDLVRELREDGDERGDRSVRAGVGQVRDDGAEHGEREVRALARELEADGGAPVVSAGRAVSQKNRNRAGAGSGRTPCRRRC